MTCPSLLYLITPDTTPFPGSLITDLKLDRYFSEEVIGASSYPCADANLTARQQLISFLMIPPNEEKLMRLYERAKSLADADLLFRNARCPAEKNSSFVAWMRESIAFFGEGAGFSFGDPLTKRFSAFCREQLAREPYPDMIDALTSPPFSGDRTYRFVLRQKQQTLQLRQAANQGILAELSACAERLGITDLPKSNALPARLSPDIADALSRLEKERHQNNTAFFEKYADAYCPDLPQYDRELSYLTAMVTFLRVLTDHGIPLHFAERQNARCLIAKDVYDVSLLSKGTDVIVPNDVFFSDDEPFFFLSGANGGGKTTYLRAVGILCFMYLSGAPLACTDARIGGIRSVFTHFPRDERFDGSGRFAEEKKRVNEILLSADRSSLLLFNETYASTTEENACRSTAELAEKLREERLFTLYITHQAIKEDARFSYLHVVIDKDDTNRRTYRIARQKNDGGSFAADILKRYRLDRASLEERLAAYRDITASGTDAGMPEEITS